MNLEEQGGVYGSTWRDEKEGGNVVILISEIKEKKV